MTSLYPSSDQHRQQAAALLRIKAARPARLKPKRRRRKPAGSSIPPAVSQAPAATTSNQDK
jgi:hypothetical protein